MYDFCNIDSKKYNMFGNYDDFYNSAGNSILFCAVKHREVLIYKYRWMYIFG